MKKDWTDAIKDKIYNCIIANTSAIWQHAAHTTDQLTSSRAEQKGVGKLGLCQKT